MRDTPCSDLAQVRTVVLEARAESSQALEGVKRVERRVAGLKWGQWAIGILITVVGVAASWQNALWHHTNTTEVVQQSSVTAEIVTRDRQDSTRAIALVAAQEGARLEHERQAQYDLDHPAPIAREQKFRRVK